MPQLQKLSKQFIALLFLAGTIALSACGWHLRGNEPLPEDMQVLYLSITNENSDLSRSLQRSLQALGVTLVAKSTEAPLTLAITEIDNQRRTISTSSRGKAAEYELTTYITYELRNKLGERLFGPDTVSAEKIYLFDPNKVVSAFEEEQLLRQEMQRDLVRQLIRRYRASRTTEAETP